MTPKQPRKKQVKRVIKGWIINLGMSAPDRRKIKVYLTKKRALQSDHFKGKALKKNLHRLLPVTITYTLPRPKVK